MLRRARDDSMWSVALDDRPIGWYDPTDRWGAMNSSSPRILSPLVLTGTVLRATGACLAARVGRYNSWPSDALLLDEPLALAEEKTSRLRRIYAMAGDSVWDGPTVFRESVARHAGIQLSNEGRAALAHPISMLMWGELAAWIVSAELAERLEDADARMAASSQVFDEARHFYVLRDYLALLHFPVPRIDPYFVGAARSLLATRDLTLKLCAMQILVEGSAQGAFDFLANSGVEPVLCEILPYVMRDEARHVGLGVLHLPERLAALTPGARRRLSRRIKTIGDLLAAAQMQYVDKYIALGLDPRELLRRVDGLLTGLAQKLGRVPGRSDLYFSVDDPSGPDYEKKLDLVLPRPGTHVSGMARALRHVVKLGARALAA
jgi:hypothetical protein